MSTYSRPECVTLFHPPRTDPEPLVGALDAIMGNPFIKPTFNFLDADGIIANHVLTSFSDDIKGKGTAYYLDPW